MLELLAKEPLKVIFLFVFISLAGAFVFINLKRPKLLFFVLIAYIPFSFRTNSGCLAMYLFILFFILLLFIRKDFNPDFSISNLSGITIVLLVFLASQISLLTTDSQSIFVNNLRNKIQLAPRYYLLLTMVSNVFVYLITKRFVRDKKDLIIILKILVFSGFFVTFVGYLQLLGRGLYFFKYIVIAESPNWATRIAGTMQGYEMFAEYTGLLLVLSIGLFLISGKRLHKIIYLIIILNFIIIMALTQTRGIYVALGIAVIYLVILMGAIGRFRVSIGVSIASVSLIIMLGASVYFIDQLRPEHSFIERFEDFERFDLEKKQFSTRTLAWASGMELISNMTAVEKIFGAGNKYLNEGERAIERLNWPHCMYMTYILRDGFLGLSLFAVFLVYLYCVSIKGIISRKTDKQVFILSVCLHICLIIFIVHEIKIEFLRHDRTQNFYWMFFALISSLPLLGRAKTEGGNKDSNIN